MIIQTTVVMAHSGRTDSGGGYNGNRNVSGIGSYPCHHRLEPHLYPDGVCPYGATGATPEWGSHLHTNGVCPYSVPAATPKPEPIRPPSNVKAVGTSNTITISWDLVDSATGYDVSLNGHVIETNDSTVTYTGLTPNTKYEYSVKSNSGSGDGEYIPSSTIYTLPES
ncbi:MAG: fibronectin type III domain-containing protein [Clostridiales bacterium]|nr:fibronectin type III domain-containing protein [Clostridiales bacterium]